MHTLTHQRRHLSSRMPRGFIPLAILRRFKNPPAALVAKAERFDKLNRLAIQSKLSRVLAGAKQSPRQRTLRVKLNRLLAKERDAQSLQGLRDLQKKRKAMLPAGAQQFIDAAPAGDRDNVRRLYLAWGIFNARFFDSKLRLPKIGIEKIDGACGRCGMKSKQTYIDLNLAYFNLSGSVESEHASRYAASKHKGDQNPWGFEWHGTRAVYGNTASEAWEKCCWTLLHEMAHQAAKERGTCDGHGEAYTAEVNRIGKMLNVPMHKPTYDRDFQAFLWPQVKAEKLPTLAPQI